MSGAKKVTLEYPVKCSACPEMITGEAVKHRKKNDKPRYYHAHCWDRLK